MTAPVPPHDAAFARYGEIGAYHWREVGGHWIWHNSFTAERYRRTLDALGPVAGKRVLDYGCGDGALLAWICRRVGATGEAHGYDPNDAGRALAETMTARHGLSAVLHGRLESLPDGHFDGIVCADVIEHVLDVDGLLADLARLVRPGGKVVITTPVRLTETPEDPSHVREWFPEEFARVIGGSALRLLRHEQVIPAAAAEVFYWRPWLFLRVPIFRVLCNVLSIYFGVNALSFLRLRSRLFMMQLAVLEKPA